MKIPRIKINVNCGEADIVWNDFDSMDSLWKYDVLKDLKYFLDNKFDEVIEQYERDYCGNKSK